MGANYKNHQ